MKLKAKDMDIATGGIFIVILNKDDARVLDLHLEDRVLVKKGRRSTVAVLDIAESEKAVPRRKIGLFEEMLDFLKAKNGDEIEISLEKKPESVSFIKEKLNGRELDYTKILAIVDDIVHNNLTTIELTYFISACYTKGLTTKETVALTRAMINTGNILRLKQYPVLDKHSIGGVAGNRTTMVVVPILVAAGLTVPKTSSRSITSPAGTADTMEVLAKVDLDLHRVKEIVEKIGGCMVWGGAINLSPADDKIIRVENPLSIDSEGNMLSSILAKKGSVSSTHVLIDIPLGRGAKITSRKEAEHLSRQFEKVGRQMGMRMKTIVTDGSQPIGNGIGPALEARDVLYLLMNDKRAPQDLRKKSLMLAEEMLEMAGRDRKLAKEMLDSGKAYKKMCQIIKAQGGARITEPSKIKIGSHKFDFKSGKKGKIIHIDNQSISRIARIAGAPQDKGAGIYLYKHKNDLIKKGERIFTVYAESREKLEFAKETLKSIDGAVVE